MPMSKLLTIPIISAYLYGIAILTQYGYNSYFNIPSNLIDASITENFVFFFQMFHLASAIAGAMKWWMWLVLIVSSLIVFLFYFSHRFWRFIISAFGFFILCYFLYGSYNFGQLLAKTGTEFYVPSEGCVSLDSETVYIIPSFYGESAILVAVDSDSKLTGEVVLKNMSELGCGTIKKSAGLIKRN